MFSVLSRNRDRRLFGGYFPVFLLIFFALAFCLGVVLFIVRQQLVAYCHDDVSSRLELYLQDRTVRPVGPVMAEGGGEGMRGLPFIRVIRGKEQMFLSGEGAEHLDFTTIVNLDPDLSAAWISLGDTEGYGDWSVYSRRLEGGVTVQAGKRYPEVVRLYRSLQMYAAVLLVPLMLISAGLSLYCRRRSRRSLREVERSLQDSVSVGATPGFLQGDDEDSAQLYRLLNDLISHNSQLVKEMQESLDNVAHDLRTPMTRLRSVAEYGLRENTKEKLTEALSDCLEESEMVLSMLTIMMSVAEAESGTMRLSRERVSLRSTMEDVVSLYEYVAEENNVDLLIDIDPSVMIDVDKTRIRQVWANLVDNGIKYNRKSDGYVRIRGWATTSVVTVLFEDNGMGISPSEQKRIWERLFRGDRSRTRQGLGLGLNYVKAVIEAHGGRVEVESELHSGSCFKVLLPLAEEKHLP